MDNWEYIPAANIINEDSMYKIQFIRLENLALYNDEGRMHKCIGKLYHEICKNGNLSDFISDINALEQRHERNIALTPYSLDTKQILTDFCKNMVD